MGMATNVHGEGAYHFEWEERDHDGCLDAKCQRDIYGANLLEALTTFLTMHGPLGTDINGCTVVIMKIEFVN